MVTERGLSLFSASQSASMPVITPLALSKNNLSVGTAIGVSSAAGAASSMGTASTGAASSSSTPATGASTASPSSAASSGASIASMLTGSKVSTMVAASSHVKNNLPNFFSLIKKSSLLSLWTRGRRVIRLRQPGCRAAHSRLDPWLCDTGFRRLCLFLYALPHFREPHRSFD